MTINESISRRDGMYRIGRRTEYYNIGEAALNLVDDYCKVYLGKGPKSVLDFACGHGRVTRWLVSRYGADAVSIYDIDQEAVDFCDQYFNARKLEFSGTLSEVPNGNKFDVIWCGSLITHLPVADGLRYISLMAGMLHRGGILVFSSHGNYFVNLLRTGSAPFSSNIDVSRFLLEFDKFGESYVPYAESIDGFYGISAYTKTSLVSKISNLKSVQFCEYKEIGWAIQDVVVVRNVS